MNNKVEYQDFMSLIANEKPGYTACKEMIVDYLTKYYPELKSKELMNLNFDFAALEFEKWIMNVLEVEPIDESIKSLYFGLFMWRLDMEKRYTQGELYVCGSTTDPTDPENDWTCEINYCPEGKYSGITLFSVIAEWVKKSDVEDYHYLNNILHFAVSFCLVYNFFAKHAAELKGRLLRKTDRLPIGIGYDDDETYIVGYLTREGF